MPRNIRLAYGRTGLDVAFPDAAEVIAPHEQPPLADPPAAVRAALRAPLAGPPLADLAAPGQRVAIVTSDLTRPVPNELLLDALLETLHASGVAVEDVLIINGTGMHRGNTPAELAAMYGEEIVRHYRIVNHDSRETSALREIASDPRGEPVLIRSDYLDADLRIVTGFIEPHLFAGYSGGGKGVMPGIAGRQTVMSNHSASMVGHPNATFGISEGNPIFEEMRRFALLAGPCFLLNVTMDAEQRVMGVFAGELVAAHDAGIEHCRRQAIVEIDEPYDIVVTSNGGYPADLDLYQSVKGIAVAARALRPGGHLILAAECIEGVGHGEYGNLLARHGSHLELLEAMRGGAWTTVEEQWQAQLQALAQERGTVWLHSSLDEEGTRATHLRYCADVGETVVALASEIEARAGRPASIGVLPYGQQAAPVVREPALA
ncbi:MAG: nickel-dependent lactate racemase [Chloroflexi bacterium]|nr:nickel-dependent lactate racemase [Chloroflexota bacterium]